MDAKAVVIIPKVEKVFALLPVQYQLYSELVKGALDVSKPAALVLTSLDPLEAYFALPVKEESAEQLKTLLDTFFSFEEKEVWSGYLFVAIRGSLPTSFGNKDFLSDNKDSIIFSKVQVDHLLESNEEKIKSFEKAKVLIQFRGLVSSEMNKILTYFVTHDMIKFLKQTEELTLSFEEKSLNLNCKLLENSEYFKNWNSMNELKLPEYPNVKDAGFEFSSSLNLSKMEFPLKGIETGFKTYFSIINKPEAIFPMDTVFEKLRKSGNVQAVGAFSTDLTTIGGEMIVQAENGKVLNESFSKFVQAGAPELFPDWQEGENIFITKPREFMLFGRRFDSDISIQCSNEQLMLYYPELKNSTISLNKSNERGLFKAFIKDKTILPPGFGIKRVDMKISVEDGIIKFKADLEK